MRRSTLVGFFGFVSCVLLLAANAPGAQVIYEYGFEGGWDDWWADNGVWEVGTPVVGPIPHSGNICAGTDLDDDYPSDANTRLISPHIALPNLSAGEKLRLRFWHWFRVEEFGGPDQGWIEISVNGGPWECISDPFSGTSPVWTQVYVDLSAYAGASVQIAFNFTSTTAYNEEGWYVDDVAILRGAVSFANPEDFESGPGDWSVDNGLWEVGTPTEGPSTCPSGVNCVGTVLDGDYPSDADTRLISPEITLTSDPKQTPGLYFWHWFRLEEFGDPDQGWVQVSVDGGDWENVSGPFSGTSEGWSQVYVDLSAYAGSTIRIGFFMTSFTAFNDTGWYIDDVRVAGIGAEDPVPDVKANGSDGPVIISQGAPLRVAISLDPGTYAGADADWWVVAMTPMGPYWYTLHSGWVASPLSAPVRVYGGPLLDLAGYRVLSSSGLPPGDYHFYFAVDDNMDGALDATYLDVVKVRIQ